MHMSLAPSRSINLWSLCSSSSYKTVYIFQMHTDYYICLSNLNIKSPFASFFIMCWVFKKISDRNGELLLDAVLTQVISDSSLTDNTSCYAAQPLSDR